MPTSAAALPMPPLAAIETGIFLLAVPLLVLMAIWSVVTVLRILIPEAPLERVVRARRRGEPAPVRLREIVDEQRRRPAPVFPPATVGGDDAEHRAETIAEALWARRN